MPASVSALPVIVSAAMQLIAGQPAPAPAAPSGPPDRAVAPQSFAASLRAAPSASLALTSWCIDHHLLPPGGSLRAELVHGEARTAPPSVLGQLGVPGNDSVRYRHVRLRCGSEVVSDADNWYVPARLTDAMNRTLDTTDRPFGLVVKELGFSRQPLATEVASGDPCADGAQRDAFMTVRARLVLPSGAPISYVAENYQPVLLCGMRHPS